MPVCRQSAQFRLRLNGAFAERKAYYAMLCSALLCSAMRIRTYLDPEYTSLDELRATGVELKNVATNGHPLTPTTCEFRLKQKEAITCDCNGIYDGVIHAVYTIGANVAISRNPRARGFCCIDFNYGPPNTYYLEAHGT